MKTRIIAQSETKTENPLGTEKMSRLVLKTSLPLMFSLLINSLYNFVDSVFVSRVSEEALTALSIAAPIQALVAAMGCGIAVGLNAVISAALGARETDKVKRTVYASLFLGICAWILIAALCMIFAKKYFLIAANGNETIADYGLTYLNICMIFSLGQLAQWCFDRYVIASGKSTLFIFTLSAASITNLILDPILIFGMFGFPAMGVAGAAIATVVGQHAGAVAGCLINIKWNKEIPIGFSLKIDRKILLEIIKVGIPTTFVMGIVSFFAVFMNTVLIGFSATAVAVFGICCRVQHLTLVPLHGITNAIIPIVAYNYGAKKRERVVQAVRLSIIYALIFFAPLFLALEFFPQRILLLFDASNDLLFIGKTALRILSVSYVVSIAAMVFAAALQALSLANYSMALNLCRQVFLPLALVVVFSRHGNLPLVWLAFVVTEIASVPLAVAFWKRALVLIDRRQKTVLPTETVQASA